MDTFLHWWQHLPEQMNPVLFQIGEFRIQYYGLMYLVAFTLTYILSLWRIRHEKQRFQMNSETLLNLTTALVLGLVIGARLGYVVFYNFSYYLDHPLEIILPFQFSDGFHFTGIT
ncbi:prolipoprotein diacylglyceryl transferase, partial [Desulfosarcina sp. OttesenSCG-928-G17]|nr:prolipoprotein diacylglyceryl transferase [Desulfosarcina sp. OttesenSCG-928-G17]